jgi:hypothetical protein
MRMSSLLPRVVHPCQAAFIVQPVSRTPVEHVSASRPSTRQTDGQTEDRHTYINMYRCDSGIPHGSPSSRSRCLHLAVWPSVRRRPESSGSRSPRQSSRSRPQGSESIPTLLPALGKGLCHPTYLGSSLVADAPSTPVRPPSERQASKALFRLLLLYFFLSGDRVGQHVRSLPGGKPSRRLSIDRSSRIAPSGYTMVCYVRTN